MSIFRVSRLNSKNGEAKIFIDNKSTVVGSATKHELKKYGFDESIWKHYVELLDSGDLKIDEMVYTVFNNNNISNKVINAFAYLGAIHQHDLLKKYIFEKAKYCFMNKVISHKVLKKWIGINPSGHMALPSSAKKVKDTYNTPFLEIIDEVCMEYANNDSLSFKVIFVSTTEYKMYYKKQYYTITVSAANTSIWEFINCINNIHEAIEMLSKKQEFTVIADKFRIPHDFVIRLYRIFSPDNLFKFIVDTFDTKISNNQSLNNLWDFYNVATSRSKLVKVHGKGFIDKVETILVEKKILQKKSCYTINKNILKKNLNIYTLGFVKNESFISITIHIHWSKRPIGREIRTYLYFHNDQYSAASRIRMLCKVIDLLVEKYNINSVKDIKQSYFQNVLSDLNGKGEILKAWSSLIDFLIKLEEVEMRTPIGKLPLAPKDNLRNELTVVGDTSPTLPIPESVYVQIKALLHKVDNEIRNAFIIMSATGCRPGELTSIREESLVTSEEDGTKYLIIDIKKQETAYNKRGLVAKRKVPVVDEEVLEAFYEQEENTRYLRKKTGIKSIFVSKSNKSNIYGVYVAGHRLGRAINVLIQENNITDESGSLWHYKPSQMRSWVVTTLIEKGYDSEIIRNFFGWLTSNILDTAYAIVRAKRLSDLNSEFFYEHFRVTIADNKLQQFSKRERKELFSQLYLNYRQMEYGKCVRHPIMGECGKLQEPKSCGACPKLITGPEYLPKWKKLKANQQLIVDGIFKKLDLEKISKDEYIQWAEVQREVGIFNMYTDLVKVLESS